MNFEIYCVLAKVQMLESKKLEEALKDPATANARSLHLSISKEIFNPQMAAYASSFTTISKRLQRTLQRMERGLPNWNWPKLFLKLYSYEKSIKMTTLPNYGGSKKGGLKLGCHIGGHHCTMLLASGLKDLMVFVAEYFEFGICCIWIWHVLFGI